MAAAVRRLTGGEGVAAVYEGSLFITRPKLLDHITDRAELLGRAADLFKWVADNSLTVLANRRTSGKLLLIPD